MKQTTTPKAMYAVLKLCFDIEYTHPQTHEHRKEPLQGLDGFIPCFFSHEDAVKAAHDGKYGIMEINTHPKT